MQMGGRRRRRVISECPTQRKRVSARSKVVSPGERTRFNERLGYSWASQFDRNAVFRLMV